MTFYDFLNHSLISWAFPWPLGAGIRRMGVPGYAVGFRPVFVWKANGTPAIVVSLVKCSVISGVGPYGCRM